MLTGRPIIDDQNAETAGAIGPMTLDPVYIEKTQQFNREKIPERIVHAKGVGTFGTFTCTNCMKEYTTCDMLSTVGKKTEMFARFSTVAGEKGSADTVRDVRGFALKFYTNQGNWDIVGNSFPIFHIRDPMKFLDLVHTQTRNPKNELKDITAKWDFWTLTPESMHQVMMLFSDRGIPHGYRHMDGFGIHTFSMINSEGKKFWVKFHFKTQQGIKNFTREEAIRMAGLDPDFGMRDLYSNITNTKFPKWKAYIQVMPEEEGYKHTWTFDATKVWSQKNLSTY
jgi:catalase